jgi:hypothetical protein
MSLDPIRLRVLKLLQSRASDLKKASLALGNNAAYAHQFIYRGTPKVVPEDVRSRLRQPMDDWRSSSCSGWESSIACLPAGTAADRWRAVAAANRCSVHRHIHQPARLPGQCA